MQAELLPSVEKGATLSEDGVYRYRLTRTWDSFYPPITWVMLNPSKADANVDDLTITKCIGFARRWGWGGIVVVNLFALRSTDPKALVGHPDPKGNDNDAFVHDAIIDQPVTVAAWGANPLAIHEGHRWAQIVYRSGAQFSCLGVTASGAPRHPSRLGYDTPLVPYTRRASEPVAARHGRPPRTINTTPAR